MRERLLQAIIITFLLHLVFVISAKTGASGSRYPVAVNEVNPIAWLFDSSALPK
ncbi:hypothetical protein [Calothrix sp. NIES-3974]|uniref:hypothetical protein n=1 Tax=Calothrix sp. NIES-3974 TaxID=2005462 RepID=UPI000B5E58A6|nr:hypothetical protein [Calothrix sp. NIES-3974]BAZ07430.1 hypothetical protein NIES3974_40930 [Calothrix sp. NIES-3974]